MSKSYVLVDGMMRTGTTLMMNLFDGHPGCLVLPFEDGILRGIHQRQTDFFDAFARQDFYALRECLCSTKYWQLEKRSDGDLFTTKVPREVAEKVTFDFESFDRDFKSRLKAMDGWDVESFVRAFFATVSSHIQPLPNMEDATHLFMKTPDSTDAIPLFLDSFSNASVIYMVRDPRAAYLSRRRQAGGDDLIRKPPLKYLANWQRNVQRARSLQRAYPNQVRIVQYEELIRHTRHVIGSLADFLGLEYQEILGRPTGFGAYWAGYSSHVGQQDGIDRLATER